MNHTRNTILNHILPAALTCASVLCMAYAASYIVSVLWFPRWDPWFFLLFCAVCGLLHTIGVCLDQERPSLLVLAAILLLSLVFFHDWQASWQILAAGAAYGFLFWLQSRDRLRQAAAAALTFGLFFFHFTGRPVTLLLAFSALLLVLTELAGSPKRPVHDHGIRLIPFLLLMECAVFLLPAPAEPFDWSFVVRIGSRVASLAEDMVLEIEYRLSPRDSLARLENGYGEPDLFGGHFSANDRDELLLSNKSTRHLLYLAGEEYASFADGQWEPAPPDGLPYLSWYLSWLKALYDHQITPEKAACFSQVRETQITYQSLRTSDVIRPAALIRLDDPALKDMTGDDGSFSFPRNRKRGYAYYVTFLDIDYANPYLTDLLRSAGQDEAPWPAYEAMDAYSRELYQISLRSLLSAEDYAACARSVQEMDLNPYLDLGDTAPRVSQLAHKITENCGSDHDRCKAIENYLRQYPYTKDVSYQGYKDIVDAFLFEKQTGYCLHYAAAMVMMLRSLDIPARLVSGYCCDYDAPVENGYAIRGRHAHAWPEAFLEGIGWVRFEPTAAIASASDTAWNLLLQEDLAPAENGGAAPVPEPEETGEPAAEPIVPPAEDSPAEEPADRVLPFLLLLAAVPLLYLLLLLCLLPLARQFLYRRKDDAGRLAADIRDLCWLIRALCPGRWDNRPLLNYAAALKDDRLREQMEHVCFLYYRLRYRGEGGCPPEPPPQDGRTLPHEQQPQGGQTLPQERTPHGGRTLPQGQSSQGGRTLPPSRPALTAEEWATVESLRRDLLRLYIGPQSRGAWKRRLTAQMRLRGFMYH